MVFWSAGGTWVYGIDGTRGPKLSLIEDLDGASLDTEANELLIPTLRKGTITRVRFEPFASEIVTLPVPALITWIRHSPTEETCYLLDSKSLVHCYDRSVSKLLWRTPLRSYCESGRVGVGTYSGNGHLIGFGTNLDTIVLEAQDGAVSRVFRGRPGGAIPLVDNKVLRPGGGVLDLVTGETSEGILSSFE